MVPASQFGGRMVPATSLLISIIEQGARYEFCLKPAAALAIIHSGIPLCHKSYWNEKLLRTSFLVILGTSL